MLDVCAFRREKVTGVGEVDGYVKEDKCWN
jgi:hypothetical protein